MLGLGMLLFIMGCCVLAFSVLVGLCTTTNDDWLAVGGCALVSLAFFAGSIAVYLGAIAARLLAMPIAL
jgi:uncharacterized membrane protein